MKREMSFLDHLEELRWHLIRSFFVITLFAIVVFFFGKEVYNHFLLAHINPEFITYKFLCDFSSIFVENPEICNPVFPENLIALKPTDQLMNLLWVSIILGFILAFPYILFEIWKFIKPGLHINEQKKSRGFIFASSFLFFIGIAFSFYVIAPISTYFFYTFKITDSINNSFEFTSHISLITNMLLGIALMFELPVIIYFLTKIGLVSPEFLKKYRKVAIVIVLVVAAVITPPDVMSQIIVAIPILILYEFSIQISKRVIKNQLKNE